MKIRERRKEKLQNQIDIEMQKTRRLQGELSQIAREIEASPERSIDTDKEAMQKNTEISKTIQNLLALENQLRKMSRAG